MKVGYVRISTHEQNEALQMDALQKAGCEKIFIDKGISGSKKERIGLNEALAFMRKGDTFVVWKLDRAGRSLRHLIDLISSLAEREVGFISLTESIDTTTAGGMLIFHIFGALAEFERALIRERTHAGLEAARARGHKGGRPRKIRNGRIERIRQMYADKSIPIMEICEMFGISKPTLYRYVEVPKQADNLDS